MIVLLSNSVAFHQIFRCFHHFSRSSTLWFLRKHHSRCRNINHDDFNCHQSRPFNESFSNFKFSQNRKSFLFNWESQIYNYWNNQRTSSINRIKKIYHTHYSASSVSKVIFIFIKVNCWSRSIYHRHQNFCHSI